MKILGLIPARGGSKGVPGKNLLSIDGKPLLAYAIEAGQGSTMLSELVVNSEDDTIIKQAEFLGCKAVRRPLELATDTANVVDTALDTLNRFEGQNIFFDAVLLLQPTAPLRTSRDIDKAIELFRRSHSDAVISMIPVVDNHPARIYRKEGNKIESEMPEYENARRQDLPIRYIRNGCIYLVRTEVLKKEKTFMPQNKSAYIMSEEWAVNIDTEIDVIILQALIRKWKKINS